MEEPEAPAPPPLRRRNSIATTVMIPSKLSIPFGKNPAHTASLGIGAAVTSLPTLDFELISLKPSSLVAYTSLKDLLPSHVAVNSPTLAATVFSAGEISIRNRLVKQAAWAYLRPVTLSSSPGPSGSQFLSCIWLHLSAGVRFVSRMIDWILQSIRIPVMFR